MSKPKNIHKVQIRKTKNGKYDVRIRYGKDILYISKQGYENKADCKRAVINFIKSILYNTYLLEDLTLKK